MLASTLTTAALFFLGAVRTARASPCVAMDANFNLYAFGLNGKDWNAGTQDSWGSSQSHSCLAGAYGQVADREDAQAPRPRT
jgi:hypothetical protein